MISSDRASHSSEVSAPCGDAVAAEDAPDRLRVSRLDRGDVEAEFEAGATPRHPRHAISEDGARQGLAVGCGGDRDARVGVEVINVRGVDEAVHGRVDRRRGAADAMAAVVESRHHLVLAFDAGIDVHERAQSVEAQRGEALGAERAQVSARALDPQEVDCLAGHWVNRGALGGGVSARVVGVLRVGAQAVAAGDEIGGGDGDGHWRAFLRGSGVVRRCGWRLCERCREPAVWETPLRAPAGLGAADALGGDLLRGSRIAA